MLKELSKYACKQLTDEGLRYVINSNKFSDKTRALAERTLEKRGK